MKNKIFNKRRISFILIFLITFMFLADFSCVIAASPSSSYKKDIHTTITFTDSQEKITTTALYHLKSSKLVEISPNCLKANFTVVILSINTTKTVDVLKEDNKVIELYNSRLGIKSSDSEFILLPEESTVLSKEEVNGSQDDVTMIDIPGTETIIGVTTPIEIVPLDAMVTNVSRRQSIESLNEYEVTCLFSELANSELFENILYYSIDWGDDSPLETYSPSQREVSHFYKNSGTYLQTLYVTDISGTTYKFTNNYTVEYEGHLLHTYLVFDEYKEPIATTSAGIGLLALLGFILTETGKYKLLALLSLLIPMYTRIQKDDVLDHFVRGEIYGFIKSNPGICYNEIMKKLDVKNGTLSYHLHKLEKMEMVKSRREGVKYRAFYAKDIKFPQEERFRLTELQINILNTIKGNIGITQREIAKKLSMKPQTINYNIKVLQQSELIKLQRKGRRTACYPL